MTVVNWKRLRPWDLIVSINWWVSAALGKSKFGLCGVACGMVVIPLSVFVMRLLSGSATEMYEK